MNKLFYFIMVIILLLMAPISLAIRDIFALDTTQAMNDPLANIILEDLSFVGTLVLSNKRIGFVTDTLGRIFQLQLGQKIGQYHSEVINISSDQLLLSDGQHYHAIK